jgi:Spy/CpxP family protein refolding chaperone
MFTVRKMVPALGLAISLAGLAAYAAGSSDAPGAPGPGGHRGHHGGMSFVLHKLDLTAEQRIQVKSILGGEKGQFQTLHVGAKANRHALAVTAPTDPGYPALIQTAQTNAATRIKLESEAWSAIYTTVLTTQQRQAIPGIVAAAEQQREARQAAWKAQHDSAAAPASE